MSGEKFGSGRIFSKITKALGGYGDIREKAVRDQVIYARSIKGDRIETERERVARVSNENQAVSFERTAAALAVEQAASKYTEASETVANAWARLSSQIATTAAARAAVAVNPQNAGPQLHLLREERSLLNEQGNLDAAELALSEANQELDAAREREKVAQLATPETTAAIVSETQRQLNYAAAIEGKLNWSTLSQGTNDEASRRIKIHSARNDLEKAIAQLTEAVDRKS